jgi:hypothetical protein
MRHLKTCLAVLGAATVLVLAANTVSMAATGSGFILGKTNSAGAVTTLQRTTTGPALKITNSSSASAPLVTNGTGKVVNLHADKLDGLDGAGLQTAVWEYTLPDKGGDTATSVSFSFPGLPAGRYLASYSVTATVSGGGVLCDFLYNTNQESAAAIGGVNNGASAVSGSGVVDARTSPVTLQCLTLAGTFNMVTPQGRVSFTRIDTVTTSAAQ